jgi:hypothetical protein
MTIEEPLTESRYSGDDPAHLSASESKNCRPEIGRGRSGIVYFHKDGQGHDLACKVFDSRGFTRFVQWVTLGAPNPYMWNVDAANCAKTRRDILQLLVPFWMDGRVTVAGARAVVWCNEQKTFELRTRYVHGRAARLFHSLRDSEDYEAESLWKQTMPKLRSHLEQAGFNGLLWQAGFGNPVALNNFLFESGSGESCSDISVPSGKSWVWIDLESGVPAIFPASVKVLLNYSLAHWWRLGYPLFDDVDVDRLMDYLQSNAGKLQLALGPVGYETVLSNANLLGEYQRKWKSCGRLDSSIQYRLAQGDIDTDQAGFYTNHRIRWVFREAGSGVLSLARGLCGLLLLIRKHFPQLNLSKLFLRGWRFLVSQKYREEFVCEYLENRIEKWFDRGQLSKADSQTLRGQIGSPDSSVYVTDFGIHIAIKPVVKAIQYWVLPALFAFGFLGGKTVALLIFIGGAVGRSLYTAGRMIQSIARGYERPWVALLVGLFPIIGNLAYPAQMVYSAGGKDEKLARFMLDDAFSRIGRHFPIWGGEDTWTEHVFNRIPGSLIRYWSRIRSSLNNS